MTRFSCIVDVKCGNSSKNIFISQKSYIEALDLIRKQIEKHLTDESVKEIHVGDIRKEVSEIVKDGWVVYK